YRPWLGGTTESLADICHTAGVRRTHHPWRIAVAGRSREEMVARLAQARTTRRGADRPRRGPTRDPARVVFLFSGQGSHRARMAQGLLKTSAAFRERMEACDAV